MSAQVWNELDEPLGVVFGALAAPTASRMRATALTGAAAVAIAIGLFAFLRRDAPLNGEPFALAKVEVLPATPKPAAAAVSAGAHEAVAPAIASAEQVEAASGVKVTRAAAAARPRRLSSMWRGRSAPGSRPRK